jgi:hypothetical protein
MKTEAVCGYCKICPVYKGETQGFDAPLHIVRNVFCNRGSAGWNNCARYILYEKGEDVPGHVLPYEL